MNDVEFQNDCEIEELLSPAVSAGESVSMCAEGQDYHAQESQDQHWN